MVPESDEVARHRAAVFNQELTRLERMIARFDAATHICAVLAWVVALLLACWLTGAFWEGT